MFAVVKEYIPGFIHAMKTDQILERVKPHITDKYKAISLDGSAFDSSQFQILQQIVDDEFWKMMRPFLRDVILHNWDS